MTKIIHLTPGADELVEYIARVSSPKNQAAMDRGDLPPGRLIRYLVEHRHWSPFEMVGACLEFKTTRDISHQMVRHRSFSFQEFSQRYAEVDMQIDVPEMRAKGSTNRQGSIDFSETGELVQEVHLVAANAALDAKSSYDQLLSLGVAPECARSVLPGCTPTRIYMHGTVRSWHHYFEQRCSEHCQKEHRLLAIEARDLLAAQMPVIAEALGWER